MLRRFNPNRVGFRSSFLRPVWHAEMREASGIGTGGSVEQP
jgi:hypothetical protein